MWFPPKGGDVTDPPWGGLNRIMGVLRSWGGCLDTLITTYSLGLSGTCADSIEIDGREGCTDQNAKPKKGQPLALFVNRKAVKNPRNPDPGPGSSILASASVWRQSGGWQRVSGA
eukprot:2781348-Prymnesium_polylepis.1